MISKGLEALEKVKEALYLMLGDNCKEIVAIEKELKALEIIKKAFDSSSIYTNKLKDSLECGWITQEEYDLLKEVLL